MLFDRAASQVKQLEIYGGLLHEIFNEPEPDRVFQDIEAWLNTHPAMA